MRHNIIDYVINHIGLFRSLKGTLPFDYDPEFADSYAKVKNLTMTSHERMYAMYEAVKYIQHADISGDIVECGVWRGGTMMLAALVLKKYQHSARSLWLYDTYAGMTQPSAVDKTVYDGASALPMWKNYHVDGKSDWCFASIDDVQANMASTMYPKKNMHFIKGDVLKTIPKHIPKSIALLRLDTDWYESTHHELEYLYPRLVRGGVLIIDDYGHWQGARKAVDAYFARRPLFFNRIDYSGRIAIKP